MQIFYAPHAEPTGTITLDAEESRHCLRVLRMRVGDRAEVVDGKGNFYSAEIISDEGKMCELRIHEHKKNFGKRSFTIAIGIALPKNIDRFEWFLEKATEIGVDAIYPLLTERTERARLNTARLHKILVSAMKQSGKAYLPVLHEPLKLQDVPSVALTAAYQKFIAVCEDNLPHLQTRCDKQRNTLVLIGPEGDFTEHETRQAITNGFEPVSLGKARLRVETAGIVACHVVNLVNE